MLVYDKALGLPQNSTLKLLMKHNNNCFDETLELPQIRHKSYGGRCTGL